MNSSELAPILAALREGRARAAVESCRALLAAGRASAAVHALHGRALIALGELDGAQAALDLAQRLDPDFVPQWVERAMLARRRGDRDGVVAALAQAARLAPQQPSLALDHAVALDQVGRLTEADRVLSGLLARHPGNLAAWLAWGQMALAADDAGAAEARFASAQRLSPDDPGALAGLADAAQALGRSEAERWARERLANLRPGDALRQAELGDALRRDERMAEAAAAFARARALDGDDLLVRWLAWQTLPVVCADEAQRQAAVAAWDAELTCIEDLPLERRLDAAQALAILDSTTSFHRHYLGEPLVGVQRRYGTLLYRLARIAFDDADAAPVPTAGAAPRIGFVSSHFHEHTVLKLFGAWLGACTRAGFETWAFHLDPVEDAATARVRGSVNHFVSARSRVEEWPALIRAARLDVLVHLDVGMHPHSQVLSALRLAPLQAVAWGHPVTTGLSSIDLFLSGAAMEAPAGDAQYSERLLRLPGLGVCYARPDATPVAAPLTLPEGARGYLFCPQTAAKLHPGHDPLFAAVAAACPDHPIVLTPHARAHVREALAARMGNAFRASGLDPGRHLRVLPMLPWPQFLGLAGGATAMLDSLDWSGGNTTLETLAWGVPVVSLPGATMRSRHSAGLLALGGLEELIAADARGYVDRVQRIAHEPDWRQALSQRVTAAAPAWYDTQAPLAALRDALRPTRG
jgi:predicted O-linked N-acetylglucosamine transferase (SPINDLY family)